MTLTLTETALVRRLCAKKAMIITETQGGATTYAAYPLGDRRRRAISWIGAAQIRRFLAEDILVPTAKGYEIRDTTQARNRQGGAAERRHAAQHQSLDVQSFSQADGSFRPAWVNRQTRSSLEVLAKKLGTDGDSFLSAAELEAGERLAQDYARSMMGGSITQNYENTGGSSGQNNGPQEIAARALDARRRYLDALDYVGPGLSRAVSAICCEQLGIEQLEIAQGWAKRSGKTVLKIGLERLSQFYGTQPGLYVGGKPSAASAASASR